MIEKPVLVAILEVLSECDGYPLAENSLFMQVNIKLSASAVSSSDLKRHLNHCKDKGFVDYQVDTLDGPDKWFITERGKVALR